jgi:hypothetical protein
MIREIEPPSVENLKVLYESELYQNVLSEFVHRSNRELDNFEPNSTGLYNKLEYCQRRFGILNTPSKKIMSAFGENRNKFLEYQIAATIFFSEKDKNLEFRMEKSDLINGFSKIDPTYLLERFCEFYLLQTENKTRLLQYIGYHKTLFIVKYVEQITQIYRQTISKSVL